MPSGEDKHAANRSGTSGEVDGQCPVDLAANPADVFERFLKCVGVEIDPFKRDLLDQWREKLNEPVAVDGTSERAPGA